MELVMVVIDIDVVTQAPEVQRCVISTEMWRITGRLKSTSDRDTQNL
jgi:hypothetical protein